MNWKSDDSTVKTVFPMNSINLIPQVSLKRFSAEELSCKDPNKNENNSASESESSSEKLPMECKLCLKRFNLISDLQTHLRNHYHPYLITFDWDKLQPEEYICHECGKRFYRPNALYRHSSKHHPVEPAESLDMYRNAKGRYHCPIEICGKSYDRIEEFRWHWAYHQGEQKRVPLKSSIVNRSRNIFFDCFLCGLRFYVKGDLVEHIQIIHKQQQQQQQQQQRRGSVSDNSRRASLVESNPNVEKLSATPENVQNSNEWKRRSMRQTRMPRKLTFDLTSSARLVSGKKKSHSKKLAAKRGNKKRLLSTKSSQSRRISNQIRTGDGSSSWHLENIKSTGKENLGSDKRVDRGANLVRSKNDQLANSNDETQREEEMCREPRAWKSFRVGANGYATEEENYDSDETVEFGDEDSTLLSDDDEIQYLSSGAQSVYALRQERCARKCNTCSTCHGQVADKTSYSREVHEEVLRNQDVIQTVPTVKIVPCSLAARHVSEKTPLQVECSADGNAQTPLQLERSADEITHPQPSPDEKLPPEFRVDEEMRTPDKKGLVDIKLFVCAVCNRQFHTERTMLLHYSDHKTVSPLRCSVCPYSSSDQYTFALHVLEHRKKSFECDVCGRSFYTKMTLQLHIETHTNAPIVIIDD